MKRWQSIAWSLIGWVAIAQMAPAQNLPTNGDVPYQLNIVLRVAYKPVFTKVYRERLRREIGDSFQAALGDLGEVHVFEATNIDGGLIGDKVPPELNSLWRAVEEASHGLENAFEGHHQIMAYKAHFVLIEYEDGKFVIRARQLDGPTGLSSPLVREAKTRDHELVARTAALLIERDFGVVGTVLPQSRGTDEVSVALQAGMRQAPMSEWLNKGDVMAISRIREGGATEIGDRVDWALLQVTGNIDSGKCGCRLLTRYKDPLRPGAGIAGYRCIKLGTTEARLRLRFLDERTLDPIPSLRVTFAQHRFEPQSADEAATDGAGFVESRQAYRNVGFVQAYSGAKPRAQMPVAILDRERIVVCRLAPAGESEAIGLLDQDCERFLGHLREGILKENERIKELNELNEAKNLEGTLEQAERGQKELSADIDSFRQEASSLRERARALALDQPERTQAVNDLLEQLTQKLHELEKYGSGLQDAVARQKDPRIAQIQASFVRAKALEEQAEFPAAIALYQETIRDANDPELVKEYQKILDKLKAAWTIKNQEHAKARAFIQDTWPKLSSVDEFASQKPMAFAAIATCRAVGDYLTPRMLSKANIAHADRLFKRLGALKRSGNADGGAEAKQIAEIAKDLRELDNEAVKAGKAP
jgi:hypothetical protein